MGRIRPKGTTPALLALAPAPSEVQGTVQRIDSNEQLEALIGSTAP
jgi:hypothetical protein